MKVTTAAALKINMTSTECNQKHLNVVKFKPIYIRELNFPFTFVLHSWHLTHQGRHNTYLTDADRVCFWFWGFYFLDIVYEYVHVVNIWCCWSGLKFLYMWNELIFIICLSYSIYSFDTLVKIVTILGLTYVIMRWIRYVFLLLINNIHNHTFKVYTICIICFNSFIF